MENKITLKDITDDMKSVFLVTKIYEVNDYYIENKETEFEKIIVNDNIFQIISDINFVYSKESENINEVHKVGLLRNFETNKSNGLYFKIISLQQQSFTILNNYNNYSYFYY